MAALRYLIVFVVGCGAKHEAIKPTAKLPTVEAAQPPPKPPAPPVSKAPVIQLAAGRNHTCALHDDGAVSCWGSNDEGELGDDSHIDHPTPVRVVDLPPIIAIATNDQSTCALDKSSHVHCWGKGARRDFDVPGAVQLSGGCAVTGDHHVWCWSSSAPTVVPIDDAIHVSGNYLRGCAVRKSGKVACWADVSSNDIDGVSGAVSVAVGSSFACARRRDGTVMCWGDNTIGQLGQGRQADITDNPTMPRPVRVPLVTNAVELVASDEHACVRVKNGDVLCWGQRADALPARLVSRARKRIGGATAIATGYLHDCVIVKDAVKCWGANAKGQLGIGWSAVRETATRVPGVENAVRVLAAYQKTVALLRDGTVLMWGAYEPTPKPVKGATNIEQLSGVGEVIARTTAGKLLRIEERRAIKMPGAVRDVSAASIFGCGIGTDGTVACWGDHLYGQFGGETDGPNWTENGVALSAFTDATQVACGATHSCVVRADGGITCWGDSYGDDSGERSSRRATIPITDATQVAVGNAFSCALRSNGHVACWGHGPRGELGTANLDTTYTPTDVVGIDDAVQLTTQNETSCVRRKAGTIACWGRGAEGQLGSAQWRDVNDPADYETGRSRPVPVTNLTDAVDVSTSGDHTCAVIKDGSVWCWGAATEGQVGSYTAILADPVTVLNLAVSTQP